MKKIIIIIIAIILTLTIIFFVGYKKSLLTAYSANKIDTNTSGIFNDKITITKHQEYSNPFKYENISFKNDFKNYVLKDSIYIKKDNKNNVLSAMSIKKMKQYYTLLTNSNLKLINNIEKEKEEDSFFTENDKNNFLKNNNINNDIDLINYIKNNYYLESNIFTSSKKIKQNYIINSFVEICLPTFNSVTLIDGNLSGYILNISDKIKELHIIDDENQFIIVLMGDNLVKDQYVKSFLESIKIEKQ